MCIQSSLPAANRERRRGEQTTPKWGKSLFGRTVANVGEAGLRDQASALSRTAKCAQDELRTAQAPGLLRLNKHLEHEA